ncbi:hypothetical protein GCM10010970_22730 [Silvimonas iriomotensis]|uniref:THIF-type NAD/FAD binding fold domain-containing protein n=2 Tax=Silvimonas iriomotensis TaxID=449662 RepID=A0ABQ2P9W0_9NEIS|nr:hypothetical protein GCM10010970_22730 [Silvimonas iriomotensis]
MFPSIIEKIDSLLSSHGFSRERDQESFARARVWVLNDIDWCEHRMPLRLVLPGSFPADPAELFINNEWCLKLPHVEGNGHLCLGTFVDGIDFDQPELAIKRVLDQFEDFLLKCADPQWVNAEFHNERESYWLRHMDMAIPAQLKPPPDLWLQLPRVPEIAACVMPARKLKGRKISFAAPSEENLTELVERYDWEIDKQVAGAALVLYLPEGVPWTPQSWPTTFKQLDDLFIQHAGTSASIAAWLGRKRWTHDVPMYAAVVQGAATCGWYLYQHTWVPRPVPELRPVRVGRIDRTWALCRDHQIDKLDMLSEKRVTIFGAGSVGGALAEALARAGVGGIDLVDTQLFEAENVSRHILGIADARRVKVTRIKAKLQRDIPGINVHAWCLDACTWLRSNAAKARSDIIVDCTGETSVRLALAQYQDAEGLLLARMNVWTEPYGAAGHVVVVTGKDVWPLTDPVDDKVNVARWPADTRVELPGCGHGFHEYGLSDIAPLIGIATAAVLEQLDKPDTTSRVLSHVRRPDFFLGKAPGIKLNREYHFEDGEEAKTLRCDLQKMLYGGKLT